MAYMRIRDMIALCAPEYLSVESYPADHIAAIRKTDDEWGIFGNFYKYPKVGKAPRKPIIVLDGVGFDCAERLFQLMKVQDQECLQLLCEIPCGIAFKRQMAKILQEHHVEWRKGWEYMLMDAMKFCLQKKYEQNEQFREELERSKGLFIVEDETKHLRGKEPLWGVTLVGDHYEGPNILGKLLMELRDNGSLSHSLPDDALNFIEMLKNE